MSAQLHSSSLTSLKLSVSTGSPPNVLTYQQDIPLSGVNMGSNSIMIPNNSSIVSAFNNNPLGTSFSHSIKASYASGLSVITTNGAQDFVTVAPPELVLDANAVTVKYTGSALISEPKLLYEDPRGTGSNEWFLVVDNNFKSQITSYARTGLPSFTYINNTNPFTINFNNIVTTLMTDMSRMFDDASVFNQPIGSWDTSNVTNMYRMFANAYAFNQPIGSWNTSNVRNMSCMLFYTSSFNQPIGSWDTGNVTDMSVMFYYNQVFNQPIGSWNTSNVTNMELMFYVALSFNQDISAWNVTRVSPNPLPNFYYYTPLSSSGNAPRFN